MLLDFLFLFHGLLNRWRRAIKKIVGRGSQFCLDFLRLHEISFRNTTMSKKYWSQKETEVLVDQFILRKVSLDQRLILFLLKMSCCVS